MFWKKEKQLAEMLSIPQDLVSCDECKHVIFLNEAQVIESVYGGSFTYCKAHRKKYTRIGVDHNNIYIYFREMEVNEHGCPLGYEPIKVPHTNENK